MYTPNVDRQDLGSALGSRKIMDDVSEKIAARHLISVARPVSTMRTSSIALELGLIFP